MAPHREKTWKKELRPRRPELHVHCKRALGIKELSRQARMSTTCILLLSSFAPSIVRPQVGNAEEKEAGGLNINSLEPSRRECRAEHSAQSVKGKKEDMIKDPGSGRSEWRHPVALGWLQKFSVVSTPAKITWMPRRVQACSAPRAHEFHGVSFFPYSPEFRVRLQEAVFAPIILTRSVSHSGPIEAERIRHGRGRNYQSSAMRHRLQHKSTSFDDIGLVWIEEETQCARTMKCRSWPDGVSHELLQMTYEVYRDEIYSLQNLLSSTQAGPGRKVKKEQGGPLNMSRSTIASVPGTLLWPS